MRENVLIFSVLEHQRLAPQALGNLLVGMESRQKCITDEIHNAFKKMIQSSQYVPAPDLNFKGILLNYE